MGVKLGRPKGKPSEKKMPNGLTVAQWHRVKVEAQTRRIPAAMLLRNIVDWYFESLDLNRQKRVNTFNSLVDKEKK